MKGNGWNDIGYNALVDRFGTVYEGRYGGIDRNVVGAHAKGFNTGSFGVAVMGDFRSVEPPPAAVDALVQTLAWRLDLAHVDPLSTFNAISSGNERFGARHPRLSPRDLGASRHRADDVPGRAALRPASDDRAPCRSARAAEALRPGRGDGRVRRHPVHGEALLVAPVGRRRDGRGRRRARRAARAPVPRSTGPGCPSSPSRRDRRWRIEAPGATPAEGALSATSTTPSASRRRPPCRAAISPNGDGQGDTATVSFTLSADANVAVDAPGRVRSDGRRARASSLAARGRTQRRRRRQGPPGRVVPRARRGERDRRARGHGRRPAHRHAHARPGDARPVGDDAERRRPRRHPHDHRAPDRARDGDRADPARRTLGCDTLRGPARYRRAHRRPGTGRSGWARRGKAPTSHRSRRQTRSGRRGSNSPSSSTRRRPTVRVVSTRPPRLWVSEAATLTVWANGARRTIRATAAGTHRIAGIERLRTLVVVARDAAGNESVLRR